MGKRQREWVRENGNGVVKGGGGGGGGCSFPLFLLTQTDSIFFKAISFH